MTDSQLDLAAGQETRPPVGIAGRAVQRAADARDASSDPHVAHRAAVRAGRRRGDRGEGVISAAIAVLIVAFLGAAMWVGFNTIWDGAETKINTQVDSIGS